jgi:hypothetical protein
MASTTMVETKTSTATSTEATSNNGSGENDSTIADSVVTNNNNNNLCNLPNEFDVWIGRSGRRSEGFKAYRSLIEQYAFEYNNTKDNTQKHKIATTILNTIRVQGRRFWSSERKQFIDDDATLEKIKHSLRDTKLQLQRAELVSNVVVTTAAAASGANNVSSQTIMNSLSNRKEPERNASRSDSELTAPKFKSDDRIDLSIDEIGERSEKPINGDMVLSAEVERSETLVLIHSNKSCSINARTQAESECLSGSLDLLQLDDIPKSLISDENDRLHQSINFGFPLDNPQFRKEIRRGLNLTDSDTIYTDCFFQNSSNSSKMGESLDLSSINSRRGHISSGSSSWRHWESVRSKYYDNFDGSSIDNSMDVLSTNNLSTMSLESHRSIDGTICHDYYVSINTPYDNKQGSSLTVIQDEMDLTLNHIQITPRVANNGKRIIDTAARCRIPPAGIEFPDLDTSNTPPTIFEHNSCNADYQLSSGKVEMTWINSSHFNRQNNDNIANCDSVNEDINDMNVKLCYNENNNQSRHLRFYRTEQQYSQSNSATTIAQTWRVTDTATESHLSSGSLLSIQLADSDNESRYLPYNITEQQSNQIINSTTIVETCRITDTANESHLSSSLLQSLPLVNFDNVSRFINQPNQSIETYKSMDMSYDSFMSSGSIQSLSLVESGT